MAESTSDFESFWTLIFAFSRLQSKPLSFWDSIIAAHTDTDCYYIPKNAILRVLALTCEQERWWKHAVYKFRQLSGNGSNVGPLSHLSSSSCLHWALGHSLESLNMEKLSLYTDTLHWNSGLYRPFRCQNIQKILGAMKTVSSIFMGVQTM